MNYKQLKAVRRERGFIPKPVYVDPYQEVVQMNMQAVDFTNHYLDEEKYE